MSEDFSDLFSNIAAAPRGVKRTYSQRRQTAVSTEEHGLITPPNSSSPPMSPVQICSNKALRADGSVPRREPTARSITALLQRSNNTPTRRPKYKMPSKTKETKGLVQMHLNLLPAHVTCKECGMSYTRTSPSDTTLHSAFHTSHLQGISLSSSLSLPDGVHRLSHGKTNERNMMTKCIEIVNLELSASIAPIDPGFVGYVSVQASRIRSFILVQPIKRAQVLHTESGEVGEGVPAIMGVSRMWTAKRERGKGKVRELLDFAIRVFVQGCTLTKSEVAFTQLSESGLRTVEKWQLGGKVLIYCD